MKQRLLIALLTVMVLAAGYGAGVWSARQACTVPPAPALLGEIAPKQAEPAQTPAIPPAEVAKLAAEIERLRPQIEAFRTRIEQIDAELDRDTLALLRPDQMKHWDEMLKRRVVYQAKEAAAEAGDGQLTSDQIQNLKQRPLYKLLAVVVVPQKLDWMCWDLKLDDAQKEKAREILVQRRNKFIALVDASPPPSLALSRLAPFAQRLVEPKPAEPKRD